MGLIGIDRANNLDWADGPYWADEANNFDRADGPYWADKANNLDRADGPYKADRANIQKAKRSFTSRETPLLLHLNNSLFCYISNLV